LYQANVGNLLAPDGTTPVFDYGVTPGLTGQLTAVASFTEVVNTFSPAAATYSTTGAGTFTLWFNPTRAANNLAGTNLAPGTPGNTPAVDAAFVKVYEGTVQAGFSGNFSSGTLPPGNAGALDQSPNGNQYMGVNSIAGNGGTNLNTNSTTANTS